MGEEDVVSIGAGGPDASSNADASDSAAPFTVPPENPPVDRCAFYHTMDIPGHGTVEGQWDLRGREREYLGNVDFKDKLVLELGTADGFLAFHMEGEGAEMITHDLSKSDSWDIVPFSRRHSATPTDDEWKDSIARLNNGYWFTHKATDSSARACHSSIYDLPEEIGTVDITVMGCILMHLRDPFLALERATSLTKDTIVIVGLPWGSGFVPTPLHPFLQSLRNLRRRFKHPKMTFLPDHRTATTWNAWWLLPPELVAEYLAILGFEEYELSFSPQIFEDRRTTVYTIVAQRTVPLESA